MRSYSKCSSPSAPPSSVPPPTVFSPEFLACLREQDEVATASEAELSGPWRTDAVPGRPGWVGVLRAWERLEQGDVPRAVFDMEEVARLYAVALPLLGHEPHLQLGEQAGQGGFPVFTLDDDQGTRECGTLAIHEPEVLGAVHLLQGLVRSPAALAALIETAGPGALAQVGRILAQRLEVEQ